jgi:DNA-nicking Smr family endonuclease
MKNYTLSDEEKSLFADATRGAKRLSSQNKSQITPKAPLLTDNLPTRPAASQAPTHCHLPPVAPDPVRPGSVKFAREGFQHARLRQLQRGQFPIDARLDLHGKTQREADTLLNHFIFDCGRQQVRCALLIHGKGEYIIKSYVTAWLKACPHTLAYASARPQDGGDGALYVLFKA